MSCSIHLNPIHINLLGGIGFRLASPVATPIPEPGTWAAMAIFAGGAAYAGWRRRRQR